MRMNSWKRFLPAAFVLATTALILQARSSEDILPAHAQLSSFPMQINQWRGEDLKFPPGELAALGAGEFLLRQYVSLPGEPAVNLYIAFFPSQRTGDTIHSPKDCLPGAGWAPLKSSRISIRRFDGAVISINRYIVADTDEQDLVFYWYQAHGRVTPSEYWAKIFLIEDAIRMNRTDGALVRVSTRLVGPADKATAQTRTLNFVDHILPLLNSYIPR
jgi:EpsI family protein